MEKDRKTRVYLTGGGEPHVIEVFPKNGMHGKDEIKEDKANAILSNTDYRGVYFWQGQRDLRTHGFGKTDREGYGFEEKQTSERFDISIMDWKPGEKHDQKGYKKIADILEKRSGKKGLTIVIS